MVADTITTVGLVMDIVGVILLAMPIIGRSREYATAKGIAREKREAEATGNASYLDEKIGFTVERLITDIRLAWLGVSIASLGFLLQIVGAWW